MRLATLTLSAAAALMGAVYAAPAFAQQTIEEVVVIPGRLGPDGRPVQLSRVVSYRDLDLRTVAGQDLLRARVRDTARDLCRELGENGGSVAGPLPRANCYDKAVSDASGQVKAAIASAWYPRVAVVPVVPAPAAPYVAPVGEPAPASATAPDTTPPDTTSSDTLPDQAASATSSASNASFTTSTVTNGPVPDTPANRARFGQPMSNAGKRTTPAGN